MANNNVVISADEIRSLAFGSILGTYVAVGTAFGFQMRIVHVQNLTDVELMFSYTGNTDHLVLPANSFILYDVTTNELTNVPGWFFRIGTRVYVKDQGTPPTTGSVYVSAYY